MELNKQIEFKMTSGDDIAFFMTDCATDEKLIMLKNSLWLDIQVTDNPNDIIYAMFDNSNDEPIRIDYITWACWDFLFNEINKGDILNNNQCAKLTQLLKDCSIDGNVDNSI